MIINEEDKLKKFAQDNEIIGEHIRYRKSLHTVKELLDITELDIELITKTMILKGKHRTIIAAMIPAKFRVSTKRLKKILELDEIKMMNSNEAYKKTGYPVGGMPCFGYKSTLIIDPKVLDKKYIYTGGGSIFSIFKISSEELKKFNPIIQKITGSKSN